MLARPFSVRLVVLGTTIGAIAVFTACSDPDWMGGGLPNTKSEPATTEPTGDCDDDEDDAEDDAGTAPAAKSGGEACCEGKGECVPEAELSPSSKSSLAKCPNGAGLCVPLSLRGGKQPKACVAANGLGDGVCLSECIQAIADKKSLLKPQTCAAGELCAPCKLGGSPTGACEIKGGSSSSASSAGAGDVKKKGKCPAGAPPTPAVDAGTAPPASTPNGAPREPTNGGCCGGKGSCVPESAVPEERRESLEAKTCPASSLCAPTEMVDLANFKPKRCKGASLVGEYEGVCLSNCLAFGFVHTLASEQGSCDSDHRCLPCELGIGGIFTTPTGAPGCE